MVKWQDHKSNGRNNLFACFCGIIDCPFIEFESTYRGIDDCINFTAAAVFRESNIRKNHNETREYNARPALVIRKQDPVCSFYRYPAGDLC